MDAAAEVKSRLSIEDVIAEYVELKRAGRNYKGLSPFGSEKTPSFIVSPEKGIWHDFSSGRGGDVFSFVMEMEGMDFKQALEHLARKAGVDLAQYQGSGSAQNAKRKQRLYEASELAAKFYQVQFSRSRAALEYVLGTRQFSKETALEWQLGYSPNTGFALVDFLLGKGFSADEIHGAGLAAAASRYSGRGGRGGGKGGLDTSGLRDMFRGRLMIPLHDATGRVVGFTARLLEDDPNAPKYINTPETLLYDKSRHVFGLHLAKEAIRKSKFVVIAEGNFDVIQSHQAAVRQVVATAGTALTEGQLKALSKFTSDIRLSYDQDKAGLNATERAIGVASKAHVSLSMITIPSGKDPDELIKQDPAAWRNAIEKHQYALDWLIERYQSLLDVSTAQGKREFSDVLLPVVHRLDDSVERDHYLQRIAAVIGVRREALDEKFQEKFSGKSGRPLSGPAARRRLARPRPINKAEAEQLKMQDQLLALALLQPPLRRYLAPISEDMLFNDDARALLRFLRAHPDFSGREAGLAEVLRPLEDYVKILSVAYEELYQGIVAVDLEQEASRQQTRLVENYVKTEKQIIAEQLESADETATRRLLEQVRALDQLLHTVK